MKALNIARWLILLFIITATEVARAELNLTRLPKFVELSDEKALILYKELAVAFQNAPENEKEAAIREFIKLDRKVL